jgi:hypothetical protein
VRGSRKYDEKFPVLLECHDVAVLGRALAVVDHGEGVRRVAERRMGRDVLDQFAADIDAPAVADALEIVLAGHQHGAVLITRADRASRWWAREHVRVGRRPASFNARAGLQPVGCAADHARPQRQSVRLADHQEGIAVVDDVVHRHVEGVVPPSVALRARPQALGSDHELDLARRSDCLRFDPHRADPRQLDPSGTRRIDAAGEEVAVADELSDEAIDRPVVDLERRSDLFDFAVGEHRHPVRHRHRLGLIVRHIDHGDADLAMDTLDLDLHLLAQVLVERAEGLVEQQHIGIEHEAARERHPLLLAAG